MKPRSLFHRFISTFLSLLFIGSAILTPSPVVAATPSGTALQFDGAGQYVTFGPASSLGVTTFTVETWFNQTGAGSAVWTGRAGTVAVPLVTKGRCKTEEADRGMNYFLGIDQSGVLVADYQEGAGQVDPGLSHPVKGITAISPGTWHHAAAAFDGATWRLYLDGELEATLFVGSDRLPDANSNQHAALATALDSKGSPNGDGGNCAATGGFFQGALDEVRIWNDARSQAQIQSTLNQEITTRRGLVARWGLTEGSGQSVRDSSGSGADGTVVSGAAWVPGAPFARYFRPPRVRELEALPTAANQIYLAWSGQAQGAAGPIIERARAANEPFVGVASAPPGATSYTDSDLAFSTSYCYRLATGGATGRSRYSNVACATTPGERDYKLSLGLSSSAVLAAPNASASAAPNAPALNAPANGATGVSTSPALSVNVSDPDSSNLTVTFFGMPVSATPSPDFTFLTIPDTQYYVVPSYHPLGPTYFNSQTSWAVNNRSAQNIVFVQHLGDITSNGGVSWNTAEWDIANTAMSKLEMGTSGGSDDIPFALVDGNTDLDNGGVSTSYLLEQYFGVARFSGRPYYGGHYGTDNRNSYSLFSVGSLRFIVIDLAYNAGGAAPSSAILNWADGLLKADIGRRGIVVMHNVFDLNYTQQFSIAGQAVYDALKGNANLLLLLGGHVPGQYNKQDTYNGHTIYSMYADYQEVDNENGDGWFRLLKFSPSQDRIQALTYSPYLNQSRSDILSQFTLPYDMHFQLLGSVSVASGQSAGVTWPNLSQGTQYEWYVTVNDGQTTTTGPLWTFTPGSGSQAPAITTQPADRTVNAGQTASFSAAASGSPAPTVQWQVSTNGGSTWNNISGAASPTYSFTAQATDNGKQYRAVFTNAAGSATSSAATLTVNVAPVVTTQPANQSVNAGQAASFSAAASGTPAPTAQWQVSTNGGSTWSNITGATSAIYSFTTAAADNGKQYRAVFTNAAGSATSNAATLTVNVAPVVTTQPANQSVNAGQTASFSAAASGSPAPTVQWQVSVSGTWTDIAGATSATYSFTAQATDNGKQYRAVFTNAAGSATSAGAVLTVANPPPAAPANATASLTTLAVQLAWAANSEPDLAGYNVYRASAAAGPYTKLNPALLTVPGYTDTGAPQGQESDYRVTAVDTGGYESGPSAVSISRQIAFRAASSSIANATSITIGKPVGLAAGDLMLAAISAGGSASVTPPVGWTYVRSDRSSNALRQSIYEKIAGPGEPQSYTWTFATAQAAAGLIVAYAGADTLAPLEASSGQSGSKSTSITAPSLTTTAADSLVVGFFGTASDAAITPPPGMIEQGEIAQGGTTSKVTVEAADLILGPAGATGRRVATAPAPAPNVGQLVAIKPAATTAPSSRVALPFVE